MERALGFRRIDDRSGLAAWPWNPNDRVVTEGLKPLGRKDLDTRGVSSGVWSCEKAGTVDIGGHPVDEVCMVVRGSVTLTDRDGRSETFKAGEGFLIPRDFKGRWAHSDGFAKLFVAIAGT